MRSTYRLGILGKVFREIGYGINCFRLKISHVESGKRVRISGRIGLIYDLINDDAYQYPCIIIGNDVTINSGIYSNPIGGDVCTILRVCDHGKIIIGDRVGMSNVSLVSFERIVIGDDVLLGGGVKIYDTDFHPLNYEMRRYHPTREIHSKKVEIKNGAFIGAGSLILKGVTIGARSIVGAGSVVRCDIPDDEVWAGNPATFIKKNDNHAEKK